MSISLPINTPSLPRNDNQVLKRIFQISACVISSVAAVAFAALAVLAFVALAQTAGLAFFSLSVFVPFAFGIIGLINAIGLTTFAVLKGIDVCQNPIPTFLPILSPTSPKAQKINRVLPPQTPYPTALAEKLQLFLDIKGHFDLAHVRNKWAHVASEVDEYIRKAIHALSTEERDIAIPTWFHATKNANMESIIKKGELIQCQAMRGFGVFVSTHDESHTGYGGNDGYTFAFGAEAINKHRGFYFNGDSPLSTWVRLEANLPINFESVAYVAVNQADVHKAMNNLYTNLNYYPIVLSRQASDCIRDIFNGLGKKKLLPASWKVMPDLYYNNPGNVIVQT